MQVVSILEQINFLNFSFNFNFRLQEKVQKANNSPLNTKKKYIILSFNCGRFAILNLFLTNLKHLVKL